tara:strand:+ start:10489 stop:12072 length:1584 start_codon:yes stop_codon:yes gene_type:complete
MRASTLGLLALAGLSASVAIPTDSEAHFIDASLEFEGELLGWKAVDPDGDGRLDMAVAVLTRSGDRELRFHRLSKDKVDPTPHIVVPMLDDVMAWGLADVRPADGQELLLLTRGGAWSFDLGKEGYRGNAEAFARTHLIFDVPDPLSLPHWEYVVPHPDGDRILLPGRDGYALWGPTADGYAELEAYPSPWNHDLTKSEEEDIAEEKARVDEGTGRTISVEVEGGRLELPFLGQDPRRESSLLADSRRYRAPALLDVDGDGDLDLLALTATGIAVHINTGEGPPAVATRIEPLPEYAALKPDHTRELRFHDVDADGDQDLVLYDSEDLDGLENTVHTLLVLKQAKGRLLPERPDQILRFETGNLRFSITDVDGDGRPDLVVRKFDLPSLMEAVTGLEFKYSHLVYLGEKRSFERRPTLKHTEVYDEENVAGVIANRELVLDCSGDGIADLVEVDLDGHVNIRRLQIESSFFSGDSWELDRGPWKTYETNGSILSLEVLDLNGDGLGDVISASEKRLTILLSQKGRGR